MAESAVDLFLEQLKSSLHAQRRSSLTRSEALHQAVDAYLGAVERELVREFSSSHNFGANKTTGPSPEQAALGLLKLVEALPELASQKRTAPTESPKSPVKASTDSPAAAPKAKAKLPPQASIKAGLISHGKQLLESAEASPYGLEALRALAATKPIVVVGRLGKQERLSHLEEDLAAHIEWIDTNKNGTSAIGNLSSRIREQRISALILAEGTLNHKHTEPLITAARGAKVEYSYANKGGKQSILKALQAIEQRLQRGAPE